MFHHPDFQLYPTTTTISSKHPKKFHLNHLWDKFGSISKVGSTWDMRAASGGQLPKLAVATLLRGVPAAVVQSFVMLGSRP